MKNYKILIVDDVVENIQTIISLLETSHPEYRLYQANSGRAALHITETISFDLIISDWDMPRMTGIELITTLKSNTKTSHIPVIIQTGVMLTAKDLETALAAGAYDYIRKPIEPIELAARVNSALTFASMHLREIEKKNLELVEKTLVLVKNNEFNIKMAKELEQLTEILKANPDANSHIHKILNDVDQKIKEDSWQHFAISFQNVHPEFNKNILSKFPALTSGELKLCILIKLGINIKDTASLLCLSPESIKVERSRLRKKLAIDNDVNLQNFIEAI